MATEANVRSEARLPASVDATLGHAAGKNILHVEQLMRLSAADQRRLAEALINPPGANQALERALRAHLDQVEMR